MKKAKVDLSGWRFSIDPKEDWRQLFDDAWRMERDYFYDPAMHGVDWEAVRDRYRPLVERVTTRDELSDLIGRAVGELSALHTSVRGGDHREGPDDVKLASLGAWLERDEAAGGYRVARVWSGDPDYPSQRSPLSAPGVDIREGEVIRAINGVPTLSVDHPAALLRDQQGRHVRLSVDLDAFYRQFYPVFDREGLVVDVRHNRGGNVDSLVLEKLMRRAWMYWKRRVGEPYWNMQYAFRGHMVVLVDERTASDGEAFAEGFRRLGLGPVIGTRTWGGEIWLHSGNRLSDGGIARAPMSGV